LGWLSGWSYRKSHVINSASGAGSNYQIRIKAHYGSGTDSGEDVYLNSHCRTDFGDVRFTDDDGTTLLDYWMEEKVDSDYAVFWVEVADDLSTNPATIYIYYGKSDATTTSDGAATFPFFDDFPGSSIDTTKWNTAGTVTVSNSICTLGPSSVFNRIYSKTAFGYGGFRAKVRTTAVSYGTLMDIDDTPTYNNFILCDVYPYTDNFGVRTRRDGGTVYTLKTTTPEDTNFHKQDTLWASSSEVKVVLDGNVNTQTQGVPGDSPNLVIRFEVNGASEPTKITEIDWVFRRKYVSPEPSHGTWGNEETSGGITITWTAPLNVSHVFDIPFRLFKLTQNLNVACAFLRHRSMKFFETLRALHTWMLPVPIFLKQWFVQLQMTHVFRRPVRLIRLPAALQLTHVFSRSTRLVFWLERLGLLHEYYAAKPLVKRTKLFLVFGDLAVQISND
jgi:hypothetical protein